MGFKGLQEAAAAPLKAMTNDSRYHGNRQFFMTRYELKVDMALAKNV